ncbi:unnamed protein product [Ambrosiozyma monospora]|uniref:Unnamed protein product n=1 Tax=Ambrosiozyma monospora TaxID=43982 RepID=A0ACB5T3C0_AMBMO|nr:unnamed protein product [Ambrosiozyma monospora]
MVARRFSQFFKLHNYLKYKYSKASHLDFPKRAVVMKFQQDALSEERKVKLEAYLKQLIQIPEVCTDRLFRDFLSSEVFNIDLNQSLHNIKPSTKKNVVNMTTKLYNRVSSQLSYTQASTPDDTSSILLNEPPTAEMQHELQDFDLEESANKSGDLKEGSDKPVAFVKPICDLVISIFQINKSRSWLRGRAIVLVLQQLLGSTIEKMARMSIDGKIKQDSTISAILTKLEELLWPDGEFMSKKEKGPERTIIEKLQTKHQAKAIMEAFVVDSCSKVFGGENSRIAADTLFQMLQNEVLNTHLILNVLEEILHELFPEMADS